MELATTINQNANAGVDRLTGGSIISQILLVLIVLVLLYLILAATEWLYLYINRLWVNRTELLPITYSSEDKTIIIPQNPNDPNVKQISLSNNERTGIEFTYSFFLMVHPSTFRQEKGLLHIFHKGNAAQFPLLGPGVYMRSDTNTLRVYMNSFNKWNNFIDIENLPVGKWVHVAIVCKSSHVEIFINGNLSKRLGFDGSLPYQNYGDIHCFSQRRIKLSETIPSVGAGGHDVFGVMKGMVSRLIYFNYALSYSEINHMMNEGPSKKYAGSEQGMPAQYLQDSWWTGGK